MNTLLANTLIATAGIIRGTLASALNYLNTLIKSGTDSAMQFHKEGIAFAREMGMNAKEAQAYTEVLTDRTERLAMKYGVAAEQVKELQRNISVATSRQLMLNESQAEGFLQLNKLVGSSTVTKFTEQMMNGMGGQLDTVQGAVSKAYATAAKSGLNAQKVSEKIANNLNMANKLSFRTGIEGLTRMAMQAEKVGLSLNSVESAANAFMEIDDAIQASAKLNMLGGQFAMLGGNPLDMAYEANADPEAFQKRLIGMAQGAAKFDAQKGIATVDPMMMDMLRNAAKAMNLNPDELVGSAKKQASNAYKESNISSSIMNGLTKEQQDFLINKSNVANGKVMFTTIGGKEVDLSSGGTIDKAVLEEMMKYQGMSDRDIMEENARSLSSINEILTGIKESIKAMFAKFVEGLFPKMQGDLKQFGAWAKNKLEPLAKNVGESVRSAYDWLKEHKEPIKSLISHVIGFLKFATEHWKILLSVLAAKKLFGMANNLGIGKGLGGKAARGAAKGIGNLFTKGKNLVTSRGFWDVLLGRQHKNTAGRWVNSKGRFISNKLANIGKFAKVGGAMAGVGLAAFQGIGAWNARAEEAERIRNSNMSDVDKAKALEQNRIDRNSEVGGAVGQGVGSILGTIFFGPLGGMIGGAVGKFAGEFIGKYWDPIFDGLKSFGKTVLNGVKWLVDNNPISWMVRGIGELFGKDWSPTKLIGDMFSGSEKHAEGGVIGGNSYSGDKVPILANSGEAVITPQQFNAVFGETNNKNFYNSTWNNRNVSSTIMPQNTSTTTNLTNNSNVWNNSSALSTVMPQSTTNSANSNVWNNSSALSTVMPQNTSTTTNLTKNSTLNNSSVLSTVMPQSTTNSANSNVWNNSSVLSTVMPQSTDIIKPKNSLGEAEYIYKPNRTEISNINGNTVTVKDFNININGTLKLDAGTYSKSINGRDLLNDYAFMTQIKNMIRESINRDINGGMLSNDLATVNGYPAQTSMYGKIKH